MRQRRAAIYGGTFDPVHNGHLEVARRVQKLFALDEVIFVPACVPPHKRNARVTSAFHRFAMLALATEDDERLRISTIELDQPDRPYAVETVARMQQKLGGGCRLFFIMGADSWLEITTWRDWQRLLKMSDQIVMTRPGYTLDLTSVAGAAISDTRGLGAEEIAVLTEDSAGPKTFFSDAVFAEVSATAIREAAREGGNEQLRELVPPSVAGYIEKYGLYKVMSQNLKEKVLSSEAQAAGVGASASGKSIELSDFDDRVRLALHAAGEKKAIDLTVLDLRGVVTFTDFFVIATGANKRQMQAITDEVVDQLKKRGTPAARVEGYQTAEWILVDYGDFIVHVFDDKARRFYDLEYLWREAKRLDVRAEQIGSLKEE